MFRETYPLTLYWTILWGSLMCLFVFYWSFGTRRIPKGMRLPPGPPGNVILGNLFDLPTHHEWETVTKWAKKYGDLVHLKVLNKHLIYVNSGDIAHELFERRSSLYSDRFNTPMINDLMGLDWLLPFMPYGDKWRRHRRALNQKFHQTASMEYYDIQTKQTRAFLERLHESPNEFTKHIRHLSGAVIMEIVYGIHVLPEGDPYIRTAETIMAALGETGIPGAFLVDIFPILKYIPAWVPGAEFRRKAHNWRIIAAKMLVAPFDVVKNELIAGTAKPSFLSSSLEELSSRSDAPPDGEEVIRNAASVAYLGGADTTVSALSYFVLAMVLYPEAQRKAQDELDIVIGDRLPEFKDREDLPYVNALCKEILRWHPMSPLGNPHRVIQDDVYGQFFIPKGSIVFGNAWHMLQDEKAFGEEPEKFNPERFLRPDAMNPTYSFGFGRRICPGRYMADNSVFIAVASILKVFNITHAKDDIGNTIPVKESCTSGFITFPEPFECDIKPRPGVTKNSFLQNSD